MESERGPGLVGRTVITERLVVPRTPGTPGQDRLVLHPGFVGVVDGATAKPWHAGYSLDGGALADLVVDGLAAAAPGASAHEVIAAINRTVADRLDSPDLSQPPPSATLAVLAVERNEIWRVGDPWVMVDGTVVEPRDSGERDLARVRAGILADRLSAGVAVDALRADDAGRAAIMDSLAELDRRRHESGTMTGVVDGRPMVAGEIEVYPVPAWARTLVIASDGYPVIAGSLAAAEALLQERLRRDPLLIAEPPMTKALPLQGTSFDDRTYVKISLGHTRG